MPPRPSHLLVSILAAASLVAAAPALAAWPHDPYGNLPLSGFASTQVYPRMITDGAGGAFIAWHEARATYDIYAQRVNANGANSWGANGVAVCTAANDQANTALCPDGAGGVIIAWHDARAGGTFDIYAQRLNSAGVPQWTANGVAICTAANDQSNPQIVSDGAGGAIICWPDSRGVSIDIYAQRVNASGVPQWAANGSVVCNAALNQYTPVMVSDGAGGAIIAWADYRSGFGDIYADRVGPGGGSTWASNGLGICTFSQDQTEPCIAADGAGGVIIAWKDAGRSTSSDIYAQRVSSGGTILWAANGNLVGDHSYDRLRVPQITSDGSGGAVLVFEDFDDYTTLLLAQHINAAGARLWLLNVRLCSPFTDQSNATITTDGSGGAIVGWVDPRYGTSGDLFVQRVGADGVLRWPGSGVPVSLANAAQSFPVIASDGAGGAILAWHDVRSITQARTYAQRIERYGQLGNPEAAITSVRDTPNDQGGQVKVSWSASYLDADPTYGVSEYRLWRSAPQRAVSAFAPATDRTTTDPDEAAATGKLLVFAEGAAAATAYAWELVDFQTAAQLANYSAVTPTTSDSVGGSNPRTAFMIEARSDYLASSPHWFSAPDSGYSVDNLPPATPSPFTGVISAGAHSLNWGANAEGDLAGYRLYRGVTPGFVPSALTLLSQQSVTGYVDLTSYAYFYKLSAVDSHGNESAFASLSTGGTTGVGDVGRPTGLRLAGPEPNPARAQARIDFDLPEDAFVSLAIYDASGREVRTLIHGAREAGRLGETWDLRDGKGEGVANGIYFVRLQVGGRTLTQRIIAMR